MKNAQKQINQTMTDDSFKQIGLNHIHEIRALLDELVKANKINEIKKDFKDEIETVGDVDLCELFSDIKSSFYINIIKLSEYIKEAFQIEKAYTRYLLYINYYDLINSGIIDRNTLNIIRCKLLQIRDNLTNDTTNKVKKKTTI